MSTRIIVADDHPIMREGLVALLRRDAEVEVLAEARDGMELVRLARQFDPDVALVDVAMPRMNGIEAIRRLRAEPLRCKLLCLSAHAEPHQVAQALEAGANGYLLKECAFSELARGIRRVMDNQIFLSGELAGAAMLGQLQPGSASHAAASHVAHPLLTPRERQIVQLFSEGYSSQEISAQLHVSAKTVATHREHVFAKLKIQGVAELTRFALREGISSLDVSLQRGSAAR